MQSFIWQFVGVESERGGYMRQEWHSFLLYDAECNLLAIDRFLVLIVDSTLNFASCCISASVVKTHCLKKQTR